MSYSAVVLGDAPVGYWKLDEAAGPGTFADSSGHGLTGTIDGSGAVPLFGVAGVVPGDASTACHFYGRAAGLSLLHVAGVGAFIDDTNGQSIEFWTTVGADSDGGIWSWFQYGAAGPVPYSCYRPNHCGYPLFSEDARHNIFGPDLPSGGTHHVVYTRKTGGNFVLYIDGRQVASTGAGTYSHTADLQIGGDSVSGDPRGFVGEIGHVALYNAELSGAQVFAHYIAGQTPYRAAVLADSPWTFLPFATDGLDHSGNGHDVALGSVTTGNVNLCPNDPGGASAYFNGSDYVGYGTPGTAPLTVEFWLKQATPDFNLLGDYPSYIIGCSSAHATSAPFALAVGGGSTGAVYGTSGNLADDAPHHVVLAWSDADTVTMYVDGAAIGTTGAFHRAPSGGGSLGGYGATPYLTGYLQNYADYDHALSADRVLAHYLAGHGSSGPTTYAASAHGASVSAGRAAATVRTPLGARAHGASVSAGRAAATVRTPLSGSAHGASVSAGRAAAVVRTPVRYAASARGGSTSAGRARARMIARILTNAPRPYPIGAGSYNGFHWGRDGDRLVVTLAEGFDETPTASTTDQQRAQGHGTWTGDDWLGGRTLTLTFAVLGDDNLELRRRLALLERAWWPDSVDRPLWLYDSERYLTARVRRRRFEHYRAGQDSATGTVVVEFYGADPFYHGPDVTVPLVAGTPVAVTNDGIAVPVRFTLHGPAVNPTLVHVEQGASLHLARTLAPDDVLTIDGDMRAFRLNGTPLAIGLPTDARWWSLLPDQQHVTYTAGDAPGAASLTFAPSWP